MGALKDLALVLISPTQDYTKTNRVDMDHIKLKHVYKWDD